MAADNFGVKIYTPSGLVGEYQAAAVTLPTAVGEICVLPQHTKYVGVLGTGILEVQSYKSSEKIRVVISGGFCTFANDSFSILVDSVDFADKVDKSKFPSAREKLEHTLSVGDTQDPEWQKARTELTRIEAVEQLLGTQR